MNKYRVETYLLKDFKQGSIIKEADNDIQYAHEGAVPGDPAIPEDVIRRNPDWFEKIEPKWEAKYSDNYNDYVIEKGDSVIIRSDEELTNRQAEAICNALNELD